MSAAGTSGRRRDRRASAQEAALAEELRDAVGRFVRAVRADADTLPPARATTLAHLDRHGDRTIAQLASARGVRHQGMSRTVAELEALGQVGRRPNPLDRRGWVIGLTDAGRAALERDRVARRDLVAERIASELDAEDRRLLAAVPALLRRLAPGTDVLDDPS